MYGFPVNGKSFDCSHDRMDQYRYLLMYPLNLPVVSKRTQQRGKLGAHQMEIDVLVKEYVRTLVPEGGV